MALKLRETLWTGQLKDSAVGSNDVSPRKKAPERGPAVRQEKTGEVMEKALDTKVIRLNIPLDPTRTGRNANHLESGLRRLIVGQDDAIQQIVNIYQTHLTGMNPPGRPIG